MSFGIKELLIVLIIVALIFGTKKLRSMGSDLGGAVKGFRKAMDEPEENDKPTAQIGSQDKSDAEHSARHKVDSSG